ncbi:MAG: hypothetical protein NTV13_06505 [Actinobacteria bacterium]|nr:hypothetical protein [Actinomycetota bacterium]
MTTITHTSNDRQSHSVAPRLSVSRARVGLVVVLLAALTLGIVSAQFGSNEDSSRGSAPSTARSL